MTNSPSLTILQKHPEFVYRAAIAKGKPPLPSDFKFREIRVLLDGMPFLVIEDKKVTEEIKIPAGVTPDTIEINFDDELAVSITEGQVIQSRLREDFEFDLLEPIRNAGFLEE
jgi:hypothetical protein